MIRDWLIRYARGVGTYLGYGTKNELEKRNNLGIMDIIGNSPYNRQLQNIKAKLCNINNTEWVNNLFNDRNDMIISYVLIEHLKAL